MPTYDYKCTNCGYSFEFFQPMSADPLKECPQCKGEVKRLIGAGAGPIFKGTGFYQTDYKNNNSGNGNKSKTTPAKTEVKTETKSESKPADKN